MKQRVIAEVEKNKEKILSLCNYIYENPEIALKEYKSAKKIVEFLREEGFEVEENLGGMDTAFKATKKNGNGPRIALVAEYDALPEIGHACGHHLIAAMGVGAGVALANMLDVYEGEISIIGTPAEETGDGKPFLIEQGVFDGFDAAMMIHPHAKTCLDPEIVTIGGYDFTFKGKASHAGGRPHDGVNALDAIVLLYNGVSVLRQQLKDGTRIHGIILEGGTVANSIPDRCKIRWEVRAKELDYYEEVVQKVINCAKGAALATGCKLDYFQSEPTCLGMDANPVLLQIFKDILKDYDISEDEQNILLGSTDMGDVSQIVPSIHPLLKFTENGEELHTNEFLEASVKPYAEERVITGIELLALTGLELLQNPEKVKELKG